MIRFYSQHGEDIVLNFLFSGRTNGVFVEVGCIDGRRFSNTLMFEEMGWCGLCIEAHADYISLLRRNRPRSIICHCAAADSDGEGATFYANRRGSLSTLDGTKESEFRHRFGEYFHGFEIQTVAKRRLDSLFAEHDIREVDVLSIDVEGEEASVLRGIDFSSHRPRAIVLECDDLEHEEKIDGILLPLGYIKSVRIANNVFYLADRELAQRLRNRTFTGEVTHTEHPLDKGGDQLHQVIVTT